MHSRDNRAQVVAGSRVCNQIGTVLVLQAEAVVDDSHHTLEIENQEVANNHESPGEMEDVCSRVPRSKVQEDSHSALLLEALKDSHPEEQGGQAEDSRAGDGQGEHHKRKVDDECWKEIRTIIKCWLVLTSFHQ